MVIRGEGKRAWLLSQWSIENRSFPHSAEEAELVHRRIRAGLTWGVLLPPGTCLLHLCLQQLLILSDRRPAEFSASQSIDCIYQWIPAGPELSLDWRYPLGQSVISRLNIKPLLTPVSSSLWPSSAQNGLLRWCHSTGELPHLTQKGSSDHLSFLFKRTISKRCYYIVWAACIRAGFLWRWRAGNTELLWDPVLENIFGYLYFPPGVMLLIICTTHLQMLIKTRRGFCRWAVGLFLMCISEVFILLHSQCSVPRWVLLIPAIWWCFQWSSLWLLS